jgi:predicted NUDIX family NTP pyrophosphohydrolase
MPKVSAGLLMHRFSKTDHHLEVLLIHPGGPYWRNKDLGSWMIPRGSVEPDEELLTAAIREFTEETGLHPKKPYTSLGEVRHKSGKIVHAWAFEGDCDPDSIQSNTFEIEWPPKSGRMQEFPEVDRAEFFDIPTAQSKILPAEEPFLSRLLERFPAADRKKLQHADSQTLLGF